MPSHKTGTRQEWLTARSELLAKEKELTRRGDELAAQRRELPWVPWPVTSCSGLPTKPAARRARRWRTRSTAAVSHLNARDVTS